MPGDSQPTTADGRDELPTEAPVPAQAPPRRTRLVRMPMVPVAAALIAGILAGWFTPLRAELWALLAAAAFLAAAASLTRRHLRSVAAAALAVTIAALGAARVRLDSFTVGCDHLATYVGQSRIPATLRGRVITSPVAWRSAAPYRPRPQMRLLLSAEALRTQRDGREAFRPVEGLVDVRMSAADYRLRPGMSVEMMGWLMRPRGPDNPGEHDWAAAARRRGIHVRMTVRDARAVTLRAERSPPLYRRLYWRLRAGARQHLSHCGAEEGRLINALIIGERHPALRALNEAMVQAGVAHFLSISGLHLGIFVGFVYLVCRAAMLDRRRSAGVVLVLLAAYVLLAEPRAALLRSAIMAAALCVAAIWARPYAALNALAGAAVLLLALQPMRLFEAGFQLSFVIVAGAILLHHPVRAMLFGRWLRVRGLMVFRHEQRVRRWLAYRAADRLMDAVTLSLTAFACAAPLVAWHFGRFSPYAPVLSLLLLAPVLLVLVPGYVSILLAWPMPNLAYAVGMAAAGAARLLARLVRLAQHLPGLSFELRPVSAAWVLLCYAAIALVALRRRIRFGRTAAVATWAAVAALTVYHQRTAATNDCAELHLLAVGDGQCAVLRVPSGRTVMLDAGSMHRTHVARQTLLPFLRHLRLPAPREAIVSHANSDHFNALPPLIEAGEVRRVYLNDYFALADEPSEATRRFMAAVRAGGAEVVRLRAGDTLRLDDRTTVDVLWPPAEKRADLTPNDTSLVLRITCDAVRLLVPGDLDEEGQRTLLGRPQELKCDVLVLPHHGGWEKTLPAFVAAADPRVVLVSSGADPVGPVGRDGAPRRFFTRLKTARRYYSTPRNGWIRVRFGRGAAHVETTR